MLYLSMSMPCISLSVNIICIYFNLYKNAKSTYKQAMAIYVYKQVMSIYDNLHAMSISVYMHAISISLTSMRVRCV